MSKGMKLFGAFVTVLNTGCFADQMVKGHGWHALISVTFAAFALYLIVAEKTE